MTFIGPRYTCRSIFLHPPISTLWLIDFEWCWLMLITSLMSEKQRITAVVAPMWLSPRTEVCLPPVDLTPGNIFIGRKCVSHFLFTGMYISPLSPLTSWNSDCQASSLENRGRRRGGQAAPWWRSLGKIRLDLRYQGWPTLRIIFPLSFFFFSLFSSFLSDPKFVQMIKDQDFNSWLYFNMYTIFLRCIVLSNWANSRFAKSFVSGPILSFWPKAHGENYFNLKSIIKIWKSAI